MSAGTVHVDPWIVAYAARYALGRQTGVPAEVAAQIRAVWPDLPDDVRQTITRDIADNRNLARPYRADLLDIARVWDDLHRWILDQDTTP